MIEILDIFGVVFICLFTIAVSFFSFFTLSKFSHEKEKEFPLKIPVRALIILGMSLIPLIIILMPIDFLTVSKFKNIRLGLNFNFDYLWQILLLLIICVVFVNFYFVEFYRSDQEGKKRVFWAFKKPVMYFVFFISLSCLYFFTGFVKKDIVLISMSVSSFSKSDGSQMIIPDLVKMHKSIEFQTGFLETLLMPFVLLSSLCFAIFGGASLAFFPIELINKYLYRPIQPSAEDIVYAKNCLLKNSEEMIKNGKDVYEEIRKTEIDQISNKRKLKMTQKILTKKMLELKRKHFEYQKKYNHYQKIDNLIQQDPLYYLTNLILGIFLGIISLIIVFHIILTITNVNFILNGLFSILSKINYIFTFSFFFFISFYFIISIFKSQFKISLMFTSFIEHHSFEINKTWVDTFLVNNNIIILSLVGFIIFIYRTCNVFSYTNSEFFFMSVMSQIRGLRIFYQFKLTQIVFILFFFMSIFISFFMKAGGTLLREDIKVFKVFLDEEKDTLKKEKRNF